MTSRKKGLAYLSQWFSNGTDLVGSTTHPAPSCLSAPHASAPCLGVPYPPISSRDTCTTSRSVEMSANKTILGFNPSPPQIEGKSWSASLGMLLSHGFPSRARKAKAMGKVQAGCRLHGKATFPKRQTAGFTLIEVMFAIAIIGVGIGSVIIAENNSLNATFRAKRMTTVAMLAKNSLIEAERELSGKTFDEVRDETGGKFDAPYAEYSWERKIKKIVFPNLMENLAKSGGSGGEAGGAAGGSTSGGGVTSTDNNIENVVKIATNYLSKSSREISVTIKWKEKGQDQKFSVSQYWVDLKREFKMDTE